MNRAIFLDRDGTINVEKHYLFKIEDFEWMPGVLDGLKQLQNQGYLLIILTNQSGIARGYYRESDFFHLNEWMTRTLKNYGVDIAHIYYCPHLPDAAILTYRKACDCRKPKLGMFLQAVHDFDIDLSQSFALGDKLRDLSICQHSPCSGILIGDAEQKRIVNAVKTGKYQGIRYAQDFSTAVAFISDIYSSSDNYC